MFKWLDNSLVVWSAQQRCQFNIFPVTCQGNKLVLSAVAVNGKCRTCKKQTYWYLRTFGDCDHKYRLCCDVGWVHVWTTFPLITYIFYQKFAFNRWGVHFKLTGMFSQLHNHTGILLVNWLNLTSGTSFKVKDQSFWNSCLDYGLICFWFWLFTIDWQIYLISKHLYNEGALHLYQFPCTAIESSLFEYKENHHAKSVIMLNWIWLVFYMKQLN